MKKKVSELSGATLDWAVAKCEGDKRLSPTRKEFGIVKPVRLVPPYSTNWSQGGPIIEREVGNLWKNNKIDPSEPDVWVAAVYVKTSDESYVYHTDGSTPLIAAMRSYVRSKLGHEVEIPEALV